MNILKQINIGTCVMLTLISSSVQSSPTQPVGSRSASSAISLVGEASASSKVSASQNYGFSGMENVSLHIRKSRVSNLSVGISQSEVFMRNGRTSFTLYPPTTNESHALSFAKSASASNIDGVWITVIQALSLAVSRKANPDFTYSVPMGKSSKFDSTINYRLGANNDWGNSGMAASFQYHGKF